VIESHSPTPVPTPVHALSTSSATSALASSPTTDSRPTLLSLGAKFVFDVYMDPETPSSSGRDTPLEVTFLERIDGHTVDGQAQDAEASRDKKNERSKSATSEQAAADQDDQLEHQEQRPISKATVQQPRAGFRVAWKMSGKMPSWLLRSERVQEFIEVPNPLNSPEGTVTNYVCWETFYGVLAPVVRLAVGSQLIRGFQVWMNDLKKRSEEIEKKSGSLAQGPEP
jgi:hypothetical protein